MSELIFKNVSAGYNGNTVLKNVNFSADKGRITALIGPNGAGKSTILKTAAGFIKPLEGSVYIRDRDIVSYSAKELYGIISVMMTDRVKTKYTTGFDVVRVGRYRFTGIFGGLSDEDRRVIRECMELIGVWELREKDFSTLSDGQKQRVLLARAIVSEPQILIMDEPASFLDIGRKIEFFEVLTGLVKEKNITVLISMHEAGLVKKTAHRVICISSSGEIDAMGEANELIRPEYMEQLFGIEKGRFEEYYG